MNMHRFRNAIVSLTLCIAPLAFVGCTAIPSAKEVAERGPSAIVGAWISELDGTKLVFEKDGVFRIEPNGNGAFTGRWSIDGGAVALMNDATAPGCTEVTGKYKPEVVRDTVRFTQVSDNCPAREEHMAWPWKREGSAKK